MTFDWLNVLKHFAYSVGAVVVVALTGYLSNADALTKLFGDLGVNALYVGIAVPALHAVAVAIQNAFASISPDKK